MVDGLEADHGGCHSSGTGGKEERFIPYKFQSRHFCVHATFHYWERSASKIQENENVQIVKFENPTM